MPVGIYRDTDPRPPPPGPLTGPRDFQRDREAELRSELARRVHVAFNALDREQIASHAAAARDATDMAVRLIIAAQAIGPRAVGESAAKHERRVRQAMSDARSKATPARRRK